MTDEPAGTRTHGTDFGDGVGLKIVEQFNHRNAAQSGRGERSVAAGAFGSVNHSAVGVDADGDPAVDMADDEAALLIVFAEFCGMQTRHGFLVERMGLRATVDAGDAGDAGEVAKFVHVGWIHGVCRFLDALAEFPGDHNAEFCGVIAAALVGGGVVNKAAVDDYYAFRLGKSAAAASGDGINVSEVDAVFLQQVKGDGGAERNLIVDGCEFQKLRRVVKDAFGKQRCPAPENADFC